MAQRKKTPQPPHHGAAAGLTGPAVTHAARVLHSVDTHPPVTSDGSIWGRRRVLLLNSTYEPLTALPMRRAIVMLMCGKADVVHDDPTGPGDPLRDQVDRGAVGDPAAVLRAGAVPGPHPDDPGGADAPRPVPLRLLRRQGRHRRPRGAAQPRRRPLLGELRGGCSTCNHRKADKLLAELGWTLRSAPMPPKGQHWRLLSTVKELDPAWVRYLGEGAA